MTMKIKFYGVRGSVPSPLTGNQVEDKIVQAFRKAKELEAAGFKHEFGQDSDLKWVQNHIQFNVRSTYGGNTTCLEIRCDGYPLIFDMGTGMRELGKAMIPEIIANKGINGTIFQSHLHWDHLQGLPFWAPLFMPRRRFNNNFKFYGGKAWDSKLEDVLKGQMNQPVFPVNLEELQHTAMNMQFETIWDGREIKRNAIIADVLARKLFHPQETFGYRVKHGDAVVAFTTDHEPYSGDVVPAGLRELIDGVDIWITDCQYSHENYLGNKDGIQKLGWGHSYPGYIAMVAHECGVKKIITTHHDPSSSDREIEMIADSVEAICDISTEPAYEGMEITLV